MRRGLVLAGTRESVRLREDCFRVKEFLLYLLILEIVLFILLGYIFSVTISRFFVIEEKGQISCCFSVLWIDSMLNEIMPLDQVDN